MCILLYNYGTLSATLWGQLHYNLCKSHMHHRATNFRGYKILRISWILQNLDNIYAQNCMIIQFYWSAYCLPILLIRKNISQNILFKANFNNPQNFISSKISHPTVTCVFSKIKVVSYMNTSLYKCSVLYTYTFTILCMYYLWSKAQSEVNCYISDSC